MRFSECLFYSVFGCYWPRSCAILGGLHTDPSPQIPYSLRGTRDIPGRRQGHLPQPRSRRCRTDRRQDHPRYHLRLLSLADHRQRNDGARPARECGGRRTTSRDHGSGSGAALWATRDGKIDDHQNWKGRFKDNSDKMRTGDIYDVADVLKSLTFLAKSKSLSFREKRMLDRARFLIVSEISEVMRLTSRERRRAQSRRRSSVASWPRPVPRSAPHRLRVATVASPRRPRRFPPRVPWRPRHRAAAPCERRNAITRSSGTFSRQRPARFAGPGRSCIRPLMPASAPDRTAPDSAAAARSRRSGRLITTIAAVRSPASFLFISLYTLVAAPLGLIVLWIFRTNEASSCSGMALSGSRSGWLASGTGDRPRARARHASRGFLRQPPEQHRSAGAVQGPCIGVSISSTRRSCRSCRSWAIRSMSEALSRSNAQNREEAMASIRRGAASIRRETRS